MMDFVLGRSCWHVVGYLNGDPWKPSKLCGARYSEYDSGGNAVDVALSQMPVCKTCDRATQGQAHRFAAAVEG